MANLVEEKRTSQSIQLPLRSIIRTSWTLLGWTILQQRESLLYTTEQQNFILIYYINMFVQYFRGTRRGENRGKSYQDNEEATKLGLDSVAEMLQFFQDLGLGRILHMKTFPFCVRTVFFFFLSFLRQPISFGFSSCVSMDLNNENFLLSFFLV